jgi:tetratricopeptide (TPR) repeat protein
VSPHLSFLLVSIALILWSPTATAQISDERIKRLETLLNSQRLIEARPLIDQVRGEVPAEMAVNLDFYYALSYVFEYYDKNSEASLVTATVQFEAFIQAHPKHELSPLARYNLADVLAIQQEFEKALSYYKPLYHIPVASVDRKEVLKKLVLIYAAEQKWEAGTPYFKDNMRFAESQEDRQRIVDSKHTEGQASVMLGLLHKEEHPRRPCNDRSLRD